MVVSKCQSMARRPGPHQAGPPRGRARHGRQWSKGGQKVVWNSGQTHRMWSKGGQKVRWNSGQTHRMWSKMVKTWSNRGHYVRGDAGWPSPVRPAGLRPKTAGKQNPNSGQTVVKQWSNSGQMFREWRANSGQWRQCSGQTAAIMVKKWSNNRWYGKKSGQTAAIMVKSGQTTAIVVKKWSNSRHYGQRVV
jgi:hypothetical protein